MVVTGPGPGSGKLATCLSQLYHEYRRGIQSGYAKFETFPIWNLPLKHPVNVAYEAATADIRDFNLIDPFHLEAYEKAAVNYNRDVEVFPVLKRILEKITGGESFYQSPTDMGVNRAGLRHRGRRGHARGGQAGGHPAVLPLPLRVRHGLGGQGDGPAGGAVHEGLPARAPRTARWWSRRGKAAEKAQRDERGDEGIYCGAAIELTDGTIVTGNNSPLMHAASSLVLHAIKHLAGIPAKIHLLPPSITDSAQPPENGNPEGKIRQPRPGGDADRAQHQRQRQPRRPAGHRAAEGAARTARST